MKERDGLFFKALRTAGRVIPGDRMKTSVYLNFIAKPRKFLRKTIGGFYRMDHIYDVCQEFSRYYEGKFSIIEFGVADGYSFTKKLYATKYLGLEDRIAVHGFDTFEGLPEERGAAERALIAGTEYLAGHYQGCYEELLRYCESKYSNFKLHKGLFQHSITEEFLASMLEYKPILIWVDCDYYASTVQILQKMIPWIPTGCVIYFDDIYYNFSSRFTGEMRAVWELNHGALGDGVELVLDRDLSLDSDRIYRFINLNGKVQHRLRERPQEDPVRHRGDDSPFP